MVNTAVCRAEKKSELEIKVAKETDAEAPSFTSFYHPPSI